ncbi:MAG: hypothetical protein PVH03_08340 [Chloroflexota bacterium]|jgi:TolB protein
MGERLGLAGRRLGSLFLSVVLSLIEYLKRYLLAVAGFINRCLRKALGAVGNWLFRQLKRASLAFWVFLGRCGLALRNLLTIILWRPLSSLILSIAHAARQVITAVWDFIGRCGLALRNLIDTFIWRPLYFVSTPFRWFYRKVLQRPVKFAILSLKTFLEWFLIDLVVPSAKATRIVASKAKNKLVERYPILRDWTQIIGWRTKEALEKSHIPAVIENTLPKPHLNRFTTAIVSTGLILLLSVLTTQGPNPREVVALNNVSAGLALAPIVPKMTNTPTATPTPVPTSTPTPMPVLVEPFETVPVPDPLGKGGSVAFTLRQNGNSDLFALSIGRSEPIRLTSHPADDRDPAWSPDGSRIAFSSRRDGNWEIYVLELKTGELRRLTNDVAFDAGPSWSPDGQWLVYESYRDNNLDLYILRADGSNEPIRLTEHPDRDFSPAWSPDGRHIAFASYRDGSKDIFVLALDEAFDEFAINITNSPDRNEDHPSWDPQARYLAYFDVVDGLELVYALPLEAYQPAGPVFSIGQGRHPSWAPDGESLVYVHNSDGRSYVIASSVDAWSVAPQAFVTHGYLDDLAWSGIVLPQSVEENFAEIRDQTDAVFVEHEDPPPREGPAYLLREIDVEAPAPYLTDRVDDSFRALRLSVQSIAGWDFLAKIDNMFSSLTSRPFPGETERSWNKAARAFDFYYRYPISIEPQVEVVREDRGAQTFWRIYLRAAIQDGSQGEPLRQRPWDFSARYDSDPRYYDQGGKYKDQIPDGYYIDFTELAADYGWFRVPARENWRTFFQGIRYWHFENRQGLTWDEAILELYSEDEIERAYSDR